MLKSMERLSRKQCCDGATLASLRLPCQPLSDAPGFEPMKALLLISALFLLAGCKPEKDPATGVSSGRPVATAPTQAEACDKLLKNDKGEYSAGKCVCEQADGVWTCSIGD